MDERVTRDTDALAAYINLTQHRTRYAGMSARQEAIDINGLFLWEPTGLKVLHRVTQLIVDYDADGRVIGLEFI